MSSPVNDRINTAEAAAYTGLTSSTLTKLRVYGGGPRFIKIKKRVLYDRIDLDAWLAAHKRSSTSEYGRP